MAAHQPIAACSIAGAVTRPGHWCTGFATPIRTVIELPGALPAQTGGEGMIDIRFGAAPAWTERRAWGPYRVRDADLFEFAMPGIARFVCRDRRQILIDRTQGADDEAVAAMLIATVLPAVLWSRGEIMLHAAAAVEPGAAAGILFAGPSGSGKSILLAQILARGGSAIADDSVRLRFSEGRLLASGLSGGLYARCGPGDADRHFEPTPPDRCHVEHPVDALFALSPAADERGCLTGVTALAALLRNRHRPRIANLLGTEPQLLPSLARVADALRIVAIEPPAHFGAERRYANARDEET